GRDLAGLEDDRAAGGEGGGHLRDDLVERVVPRRDAADDADGLFDDERVANRLFERVLLDDLRKGAGDEGGEADLNRVREREGHADLAGDGARELLLAGGDAGLDGAEVGGALLGRGLRPTLERLACGRDGAVHVGGGSARDLAHDLFGGRVEDSDRARALRG